MSLPPIAAWNVRGFNNPVKVKLCKDLITAYNLKLLCILEAKINDVAIADPWFSFTHALFENEQSCDNFNLSTPGRIWVKWDSSHLSFSPSFYSSQVIHGLDNAGSLPPFHLSVVYAANSLDNRKVPWDDLLGLSASLPVKKLVVTMSHDRVGELNNFVFEFGVQDLASVGLFYTWFNQRVDFPIHIKLDRMLVNSTFLDVFPTAYYKVDSYSGSDHAPLIIYSSHFRRMASRFMFKEFWTKLDDFWVETQLAFERTPCASPIASFYECLRYLKVVIRKKNWCSSNYISNSILELKNLQFQYLSDIQREPLNLALNIALKNTNDQLASFQAAWNVIKELSSPHGLLSSHADKAQALINHFKILYNAPTPPLENSFNIPVGNTIPSYLIAGLLCPVTNEEIKKVVFVGTTSSAPGPDGFSFGFYQHTWHIIGFQLCRVVKHFFSTRQMPRGAKATTITHIPKGLSKKVFRILSSRGLMGVFLKFISSFVLMVFWKEKRRNLAVFSGGYARLTGGFMYYRRLYGDFPTTGKNGIGNFYRRFFTGGLCWRRFSVS
ncbi:uncharacterized protein LOC110098192, partial [Dendrobium catenatum]|uniref:uncharacterized protein LOC110098192 n=1 Tax=Dendrobium catenatum TaxID=906689 RepID=UPI0009F6257B